jgi:hypothetical protein
MADLAGNASKEEYLAQNLGKPLDRAHYAAIKVLIIYWEQSNQFAEYEAEAAKLEAFFRDLSFITERYLIPSTASHVSLHAKISQCRLELVLLSLRLDAPCLLIVHYGGHGDKDDDKHDPSRPQERRSVWRA